MSADLLRDYFERDLSEAEMRRLGRLLESGEEQALRFAKLAEAAFVGLKISQGKPWHGLGPVAKGLVAVVLSGGAAVALWTGMQRETVTVPPTSPVVQALETVVPTVPVRALSAIAKPIPRQSPVAYDGLSVVVKQPKAALVTVRVLNEDGVELKLLYAGVLDPGDRVFVWDGRLADGSLAQPGRYRIQVKAGAVEMIRKIDLKEVRP